MVKKWAELRHYHPSYRAIFRPIDQEMLDKFGNLEDLITKMSHDNTQAQGIRRVCSAFEMSMNNAE